jgi:hypothetical protein
MWRELGVRPSGNSVVLDQNALHASIVRSIMASRSSPGEPYVQTGVHACSTGDFVSFLNLEGFF